MSTRYARCILSWRNMPFKLLTAASVHERGRLEWDDVTNIVYSFHSRSQHNSEVAKNFHRHIETVRTGDDLSMIHLLT